MIGFMMGDTIGSDYKSCNPKCGRPGDRQPRKSIPDFWKPPCSLTWSLFLLGNCRCTTGLWALSLSYTADVLPCGTEPQKRKDIQGPGKPCIAALPGWAQKHQISSFPP